MHNRTRLVFGMAGATGALLIALAMEPALRSFQLERTLSQQSTPALIFRAASDPASPDLQRRLERAGAKSGQIQISLMWKGNSDLDLHVIDPAGEHLYFQHMRLASGGTLDVDANSRQPYLNDPVENAYWPLKSVRPGTYRVLVHLYTLRDSLRAIPYHVEILVNGVRTQYSGSVEDQQLKQIDTFTVTPEQIAAAKRPFFALTPGSFSALLATMAWCGLVGASVALLLLLAQKLYIPMMLVTPRKIVMTTITGIITGLVAGGIGQICFSVLTWFSVDRARFAGFIITGSLLGWGLSRCVPNLPTRSATLAGLFAGALAAVTYAVYPFWLTAVSRGVAAGLLGAAIGLMIILGYEAVPAMDLPRKPPPYVPSRRLQPVTSAATGVARVRLPVGGPRRDVSG